MNVVLHEPEIPLNTGNIGRTCAAVGAKLHLIKPLGFSLEPKYIKRSGLDYWDSLDLAVHENFSEFCAANPQAQIFCATTKAARLYTAAYYPPDAFIMLGKESRGIPPEILTAYSDTCVRVPMLPGTRSLNLSVAAAVILFEALRQNGFSLR